MRSRTRLLPVVALVGVTLVPASASAGSTCNYYRWNEVRERWDRVALLVDAETYQRDHVFGTDWQCRYCVGVSVADTGGAGDAVAGSATAGAPKCPALPPEVPQPRLRN